MQRRNREQRRRLANGGVAAYGYAAVAKWQRSSAAWLALAAYGGISMKEKVPVARSGRKVMASIKQLMAASSR